MREKVVIIGAGGHAKVVAECIDTSKYNLVGFLDKDNRRLGEKINGIPIIGDDNSPGFWLEKGITACVVGIGHIGRYEVRNKVYEKYKNAGFHMIKAIHSQSIVSESAVIEDGTVIMPGAIINANAHIGENTIINSKAVVEHDVVIGNGVHVAPGSVISGAAYVGNNVLIGAGSTIIQCLNIGENAIVGAGTVVIRNIPATCLVVGNPVRIVREGR